MQLKRKLKTSGLGSGNSWTEIGQIILILPFFLSHMLTSFQNRAYSLTRTNSIFGMIGAFSFAIMTAIGAKLMFPLPFTPVPITLQTFFVLVSGVVLGRKFGMMSQLLYLLLGIMGFLQFAGGKTGVDVLLGATGGYLLGFVVASYLVGMIADTTHNRDVPSFMLALLFATLIVYVFGIAGLMLALGIDLFNAMLLGFFPFLPGDLLKVLMALAIAKILLPQKEDIPHQKDLLPPVSIVLSLAIFGVFLLYLFSNKNLPPEYLPSFSILVSSLIGLTFYVNFIKSRS